jgi:hypothetical protein
MPIRLEISYNETELKAMHLELLEARKGVVSSFSDSGTSVTKRSLAEIDSQIKDVESALRRLNPDTYGARSLVAGCYNRGLQVR